MSVFLDTNVVVYAFDDADPDKKRMAIEWLEAGDRLREMNRRVTEQTEYQESVRRNRREIP